MTIDQARKFILSHPNAVFKADANHAKYLQAVEVIERHKGAPFKEWRSAPHGHGEKRIHRMSRD